MNFSFATLPFWSLPVIETEVTRVGRTHRFSDHARYYRTNGGMIVVDFGVRYFIAGDNFVIDHRPDQHNHGGNGQHHRSPENQFARDLEIPARQAPASNDFGLGPSNVVSRWRN